ncbi:two-component system, chemotaxis family, sensor kinase CheA [Caldanaerobius fijiensis DSM 17918]|uniref:Chemotaxis protein CheA n=1 Tax=Caldanaerobius fijiensis DSM 17918 TaxID=1121256 RepID=A0A1M4XJZ0_9THEO|nr:chemotaxis protein CheA [Caldanaerobius fijiensis]SHE93947.1 two-component system, chemotaxis family, sensor kinase CheA [Caldanaerobius fijiensis DSM 17918]
MKYLQVFVDEGEEHIERLNEGIMSLESSQSPDIINEIFRSAHTLKGMAASMGFNRLADLTHGMEDLLQAIKNGHISADSHVIDMLFNCLDAIERFMDNIKQTAQEGDIDVAPLLKELKRYTGDDAPQNGQMAKRQDITSNEDYERDVVEAALKQGYNVYRINVSISKESQLKAARAFVLFNVLQGMGDIINSEPGVEEIEKGNMGDQLLLDIITKADELQLKQAIENISEIEGVDIAPLKYVNSSKAGEEDANKRNNNTTIKLSKSIRVDIGKLDALMNMVGEFLITKSRLRTYLKDITEETAMTLDYLDRITSDMHDMVMSLRVEPIERVFNRFPRMVRDLSRTLNKKIEFTMEGQETEVDMTIIDELSDPLVHLIRNSIDHGIEQPDERLRAGKPEVGTVSLKAYHDGNKVIIQVSDDGRGIDMDKVVQKAISRGLVEASEVESLTKSQIIDFLFMPGFSTSDQVTEISGRGVGLDVVKSKVEELGGNIEVITEKGKGTTFLLSFPLTLSMIDALLVKVAGEIYAVPLSTIIEIVEVKREEVKKVRNRDSFIYKGNVTPLIKLKDLLKLESTSDEGDFQVFVVRKGERLVGIVVDQVLGQQEIVIKSPGKYLSDYKFISGVTILGDGGISLIIDVILLL